MEVDGISHHARNPWWSLPTLFAYKLQRVGPRESQQFPNSQLRGNGSGRHLSHRRQGAGGRGKSLQRGLDGQLEWMDHCQDSWHLQEPWCWMSHASDILHFLQCCLQVSQEVLNIPKKTIGINGVKQQGIPHLLRDLQDEVQPHVLQYQYLSQQFNWVNTANLTLQKSHQ